MLNNRMKWILILSALTLITLACSKKEEAPPTMTEKAPAEKAAPAGMEHAHEESQEGMGEMHGMMKEAHEGMETASDMERGEEVYEQHCAACHDTGVAGAPKTGDRDAWAEHIAGGMEHMVENAVNGVGTMPPKGGAADLSDEDVRAAVAWMVEKSR